MLTPDQTDAVARMSMLFIFLAVIGFAAAFYGGQDDA